MDGRRRMRDDTNRTWSGKRRAADHATRNTQHPCRLLSMVHRHHAPLRFGHHEHSRTRRNSCRASLLGNGSSPRKQGLAAPEPGFRCRQARLRPTQNARESRPHPANAGYSAELWGVGQSGILPHSTPHTFAPDSPVPARLTTHELCGKLYTAFILSFIQFYL